jgi:REP-associated tyrosine transposase
MGASAALPYILHRRRGVVPAVPLVRPGKGHAFTGLDAIHLTRSDDPGFSIRRGGTEGVTDDAPLHHRRTIRLSGWDYSADGAYFVTVCTSDRSHLFGEIADGHMRVNALGAVVADSWRWLASQYTHVTLDDWCLMPNHLHGLLILTGRGGSRTALTDTSTPGGDAVMTPRKPVGRLIGAFKTVSTKHINRLRNTPAEVVGNGISGSISSEMTGRWIWFARTFETTPPTGRPMR